MPEEAFPSSFASKRPVVNVEGVTFYVPGDAMPSHGGAGTEGALEIARLLEDAGICCCMVGISALRYFGAWRVRHDWEICVPTHLVDSASKIFQSEPLDQIYEMNPSGVPQLDPLLQAFPRFKIKGVDMYFTIIPAEHAHLECVPSNLERSQMGIPYPKLEVFAQRCLKTDDRVALTDLIDRMNLSIEWGLENLDLDGTYDVSWVKRQSEKIAKSLTKIDFACVAGPEEKKKKTTASPRARHHLFLSVMAILASEKVPLPIQVKKKFGKILLTRNSRDLGLSAQKRFIPRDFIHGSVDEILD